MKLLLDTHTFLWYINNDSRLSPTALGLMNNPGNDLFLSIGSLWEIAIKVRTGKLQLKAPFETFIPKQIAHNRIQTLAVSFPHLVDVSRLALHHRDPFDRLIIAQAMVEGCQ